jgi:hypothetical protein
VRALRDAVKPRVRFQRAHAEAAGAHVVGAEATCVAVAGDGQTLLSRSRDDTLKVRIFGQLT